MMLTSTNLPSKLKHFYAKTNSSQYLAQNIPYTCEQQRFHNNISPACHAGFIKTTSEVTEKNIKHDREVWIGAFEPIEQK